MPITLTDPEIQRGSELLWALENAIDAQPEEVKSGLPRLSEPCLSSQGWAFHPGCSSAF